jgi:uncharacterized protein YggU (UPF0235/DUF167 family)
MQVKITVKPNSKKGPLTEESDDGLIIYLRERAVDGAANKALVELLAKHFGVAKTRVAIKRGLASKHKTVVIN